MNSVPTVDPPAPPDSAASAVDKPSSVALKVRRLLIIGSIVIGLLLLAIVVLLVFLSIDAYQAMLSGQDQSLGMVVVGLLRDVAIIFVALETLVICVFLIILMLQVQSLVVLVRDELWPMLEAVNETLATVRGTTQFVSHNVVTPVIKWSGYLAGLRHIFRQFSGLREVLKQDDETESQSQGGAQ